MPYLTTINLFTCDGCDALLVGRDTFFTHCDACTNTLLTEDTTEGGYCRLHPGCGCTSPSECTEEALQALPSA